MNVENHVVPRAENTFSLIANAPFCGKSVEVYKIINIAKFILNLVTLENEKSEQRYEL